MFKCKLWLFDAMMELFMLNDDEFATKNTAKGFIWEYSVILTENQNKEGKHE